MARSRKPRGPSPLQAGSPLASSLLAASARPASSNRESASGRVARENASGSGASSTRSYCSGARCLAPPLEAAPRRPPALLVLEGAPPLRLRWHLWLSTRAALCRRFLPRKLPSAAAKDELAEMPTKLIEAAAGGHSRCAAAGLVHFARKSKTRQISRAGNGSIGPFQCEIGRAHV